MHKRQRLTAQSLERGLGYCETHTPPDPPDFWVRDVGTLRETVETVGKLAAMQETQKRAKVAATRKRDAALRDLREWMIMTRQTAVAHAKDVPGIVPLFEVPSRELAVSKQVEGAQAMVTHAAAHPDVFIELDANGTRTNLERHIAAVQAASREQIAASQALILATKTVRDTLRGSSPCIRRLGVHVRRLHAGNAAVIEGWEQAVKIGRAAPRAVLEAPSSAPALPAPPQRTQARVRGVIETGEADWEVVSDGPAPAEFDPLMLPAPRVEEAPRPDAVREADHRG